MAMIVKHNLLAMNSNRMLGINTASQAKSTEKLSSGYKINRAADDAAGLSISEKMRKQIRGLTQASLNAQDGISAVQTAEGALNEVQDMLQRMNELSVKAANGTMSEDDKSYIQNEIDQLVTEIDRVSETTKFNETYLLKGDGEAVTEEPVKFKDLGADKEITAKLTDIAGQRVTTTTTTDENGRTELNLGDLANVKVGDSITIDGQTYTFADGTANTDTTADGSITLDFDASDVTAPTAQQIADAIVTEIKGKNDALYAANPNQGSIESVAMLKDKDGNYILTLQSRTDVNRKTLDKDATPADPLSYKTDGGVVVTLNDDVTIADGQEITIADVKLVGELSKESATGSTAVAIEDATYSINLDRYTGDEMTLVYDEDADNWKATSPDGSTATYSSEELMEMGIGVQKGTDKSTFENIAKDGTGIDAAALKSGLTLKIEKQAVKPLNADASVATYNTDGVDLSKYKVGDAIKVVANVTTGGVVSFSNADPVEKGIKALNFSLQVGADTTAENKISVDIEAMSAKGLGIDGLKVDGKDSKNADAAVDTIAAAIQKVSTQRSALGAVQNRLEHTIANLDNVVENTTAAESQIRDTDMATEMVKYSNNNILAQAGQAMLAQANQANQGVLSLLG